ncbi:hypothetical protein KY327_03740 [Candidatus Woesearchaeota archaeon]|nr:hypothetical protein [Candidatus Woesearchaeota archaeon]
MSTTASRHNSEHSPTLNTVIMVEDALKDMEDSLITLPLLKRALPRQVNHNTLKTILEYLEESGKIAVTMKGITWVHNPDARLRKAIKEGLEL